MTAETYFDCSPELLERLLHLEEHGIRIVGCRSATPHVLRLYIEGEALPAGPVRGRFRKHEDGKVVLEGLDPA